MSHSRVAEYSNNFNSLNHNSFNTFNNPISVNSVCHVNNFAGADEKAEILAWLSPLEPRVRHHDISTHRVEHVGDWLLRTKEYRNWFGDIPGGESDNSSLFCYGAPGVGKTYIRLCDWAKGKNAAVACFYFDFAAQKEQSPTSILSSILRQVVGGLENIPAKIVEAFRDQEKVIGGRKPGLDKVVQMFSDISSSQRTFICIDALDECLAEYRGALLDSLKQILHKSPRTRLFLAGRSHIWEEVEKHLAGRVVGVSVTPTKDDIIRFLRAKLKEDTTPDAMNKSMEEDIIKSIPEIVSEIFLLVSLNIKAILQETTLHRRLEKLSAIKNGWGLGDAYDATIGRIKAQGGNRARLGMAALMWISHSERPLKTNEICHALAVENGSKDINTNNVPSIRTVLSCCQGLTAVDNGSSTIRLIHFTLKEYLSRHVNLFDKAHARIAETCLTYLNFRTIKDRSAEPSRDSQDTPLLEYSSLNWGVHMRAGLSDRSRDLALDLLAEYDNHISAELLWKSTVERCFNSLEPFSALHCISYFGIAEVLIDLIKTKRWDLNQKDSAGLTPLMWAARHGREEVVKLLLQQKHTQPDMRDTQYGRTALSWAAGSGHDGVVELFLSPLFVNRRGIGGRWGKTSRAMRVLFGRKYINLNRPDNSGQTPLSWAACNGHDGVVELLLARESVNPDRPDVGGQTPLWWAAWNGHDGVVKLLLEREDVTPDKPDGDGRTPLSWAACNGHDKVVKLLLERGDVTPDWLDGYSWAPLSWAAKNGHDGVVKLLLAQEDVSPDRPDIDDRTPLSWAAWNGHDEAVRMLLEQQGVSPDRPDSCGRTPLSWAARGGHVRVMEIMLERGDVSPEKLDEDGLSPLSWAAWYGHDGIVKLLLRQEGAAPDRPGNDGRTPLSRAAGCCHDGVVELLLEREDVDPNRPDIDGRTPLLWAAWNGCDGVVKLLLEREDVIPDSPDNSHQTPLFLATMRGHDGVVKLLLERGDVNPQ